MLESADTREDRGRARGEWYADPYGSPGQERFYDGRKWTDQVREAAPDAASAAPRLRPRPVRRSKSAVAGFLPEPSSPQPAATAARAPSPASAPSPARDRSRARAPSPARDRRPTPAVAPAEPPRVGAFPIRLSQTVSEPIQVVSLGRRHASEYELVAGAGRVASLRLHGPSKLATVSCVEGSWSLTRERRSGSRVPIRGPDGSQIGSYEPRRWLPGGTIAVGDAIQVELGRAAWSKWSLHLPGPGEKVASINLGRRMGAIHPAVTVDWLPSAQDEFPLIVLVGCAVVMLGGTGPIGPDSIGQ